MVFIPVSGRELLKSLEIVFCGVNEVTFRKPLRLGALKVSQSYDSRIGTSSPIPLISRERKQARD